MIVKKVDNPDKSSTKGERIRGLTNYIRTPEKEDKAEKCVFAGARGFICQTPDAQQREMIALAQAAVRSPDPISHWILSWREGEQPTPAQVEEIVTIFLTVMGLVDHQVVYGLHADTDNWHLHLAINRVHPVTEKVVKPNRGFDKEAAHRAIAEIEAKQGWAREAGARYVTLENGEIARAGSEERTEPSQRARDFERRYGEKSAERTGIEAFPDILTRATSWSELHDFMASAGMRYEQKGSGALIWVGDQPIKASAAARGASLKKLIARFGPYEPGKVAKPLEPHPVEPLHFPSAPGWAEYEKVRHDHLSAKQAAEAELQRRIQADKERLTASHKTERQADLGVGSWIGRGKELNALRSAIAARQAIALAEMQDRHRYQRAELKRKFRPLPDFDAWLATQRRDEYVDAYWRDRDNWPGEIVGPTSFSPTPRDIRGFEGVALSGSVFYSRRGSKEDAAFVDRGNKITIYGWRDADSLLAALQLSAAKWPSGFVVKGNDAYLAACVKLAAEHGFKVVNPELQDAIAKERARLEEARRKATEARELHIFQQYDAAIGADRYRIIAERRRDEGPNTLFVIDGKGEGAHGLTADLVPQRLAALLAHQKRGDGVFFTPISEGRHHIVIRGMTTPDLDRLEADGYRPAYVANAAPWLFEAVINVEKLGSPFDAEVGERLATRLNEVYGDRQAAAGIERHRAPGFTNFLMAPHRAGDPFPLVTIARAQRRDCPQAHKLSREIEADVRRAAETAKAATAANSIGATTLTARLDQACAATTNSAERLYARHYRDLTASLDDRRRVDPSRVDLMIAIRLRVTGHSEEHIFEAIAAGATKVAANNNRANVSTYARRAAKAAFRPSGARLVERKVGNRGTWHQLESRPSVPAAPMRQPTPQTAPSSPTRVPVPPAPVPADEIVALRQDPAVTRADLGSRSQESALAEYRASVESYESAQRQIADQAALPEVSSLVVTPPPTPATPGVTTATRTPPPPEMAEPTGSSPVTAEPPSRTAPISSDAWLALGSNDQAYAALAFASSIESSSADVAACLALMSSPALGIGERAAELGARHRRGEGATNDPEVALLHAAPRLQPTSELVAAFQRVGAVNIVAAMIERLRERERGP
jgi:hypothetical protein